MSAQTRDAHFLAFAAEQGARLRRVALLLASDADDAAERVRPVLAGIYADWSSLSNPRYRAYFQLLHSRPVRSHLPLGLELVDVDPAARTPLEPIAADLARLPLNQRLALVLSRVAGLPRVEIAELLRCDVDTVLTLGARARAALLLCSPERADDRLLDRELGGSALRQAQGAEAAAQGAEARAEGAAALAEGRLVVLRRQVRSGLAGAALLLVLVLGISQLAVRLPPDTTATGPGEAPAPPRVQQCNTRLPSCRVTLARNWRSEMADVVNRALDPDQQYFSGYSYSYDESYESASLWEGKGGALAFDLVRYDQGATQVFVQISTSERFAVRCGARTRQRCLTMYLISGARLSMSESTTLEQGMEVQYSLDGTQVVTVVAQNRATGAALGIKRSQLMTLAQDQALRLPPV